jgi:hypothetical protein
MFRYSFHFVCCLFALFFTNVFRFTTIKSAQSMLMMHSNWMKTNYLQELKCNPSISLTIKYSINVNNTVLASKRTLQNLTVAPVLTVTTERILEHTQMLLKIDGAKLLWGGKELSSHSIPKQYGILLLIYVCLCVNVYGFDCL